MTSTRADTTPEHQTLLQHLTRTCGPPARVDPFSASEDHVLVATFDGYPTASTRTHVTVGASQHPISLYRRRRVGFELISTTPQDAPSLAPALAQAVLDHLRLARTRERRSPIEFNGVYAPGYPPHLLFATEITATPALSGRQLVGDRYVYFLSALPITDAELRLYDRDVRALIDALRESNRATEGLHAVGPATAAEPPPPRPIPEP